MRFIAGALVVMSGSLLWAASAFSIAWTYQVGGNRGSADMAGYGGMAIVAFGCLVLWRAHATSNGRD
jgi:hypothetical protein